MTTRRMRCRRREIKSVGLGQNSNLTEGPYRRRWRAAFCIWLSGRRLRGSDRAVSRVYQGTNNRKYFQLNPTGTELQKSSPNRNPVVNKCVASSTKKQNPHGV